jgi:methyl-accepting chemotaxis protein
MWGIFSGKRGFAPAVLVLVVVWAFAAVLMLTGTLIAAKRIDSDVHRINPQVSGINHDTQEIALAAKTADISAQIKTAAAPLSGELQQTLSAAQGIDTTAKSILARVLTIGRSVGPIHSNVLAIGSTVDAISASVKSINGHAHSISSSANGINNSVHGINSSGGSILGTVKSIDGRVAGINNRAATIRSVALTLKTDLDPILDRVATINGHANSIDCARLLNTVGKDSGCK